MEDIHGVDVSWLHHSTRDSSQRSLGAVAPSALSENIPGSDGPPPLQPAPAKAPEPALHPQHTSVASPSPVANPPVQKTPTKRPPLLSRGSAEKTPGLPSDSKPTSRRNSWISSISSKFSSQNSPAQTTHAQAHGYPAPAHPPTANGALNGIQAATVGTGHAGHEPYVPHLPKGSFISNALRRLSSGSQVSGLKSCPQGGMCPRKVMNIDRNRPRCLVPELDQNKLRRVAFCVDVEIASGPRYKDDIEAEERRRKNRDRKLKEKGEGEALKHPDLVTREKDQDGAIAINSHEKEVVGTAEAPNPEGTLIEEEKKETTKKKEKKKRSEAERKERKEKKRRKAEENGCVPLELTREEDDTPPAQTNGAAAPRTQCRPTTDPLRIYRRCCQLRETPAVKRICEQLADPKTCSVVTPGVVTGLDLSGSRMSLADIVTLSDWLAIVPVKKLLLEDADLDDEKIRVILAGVLAAKVPEAPKRRSTQVANRDSQDGIEERSGLIVKLVLKNNPKIGLEGWKHISLFLYMCKSIQAIDISMIPFPNAKPHPPVARPSTNPTQPFPEVNHKPTRDVADIFAKALSERRGGSRLEELVMAECGLTAPSLRKIIDAVIVSGVQRLGLATNSIDSEGLDHVVNYIKSGVCQGLDLGGNDLRNEIGRLAQSVTEKCTLWALCLANCNLTPESLKILFPALVTLPIFRFLDLSHNKDLFAHKTSLCLLRKYITHFKEFKRIHLMDVALTPEQTIGLAEVLPECTHLAHINILENPAISTVVSATDEASREEAVALYASLMVAAKLSRTLICVDVDVPGPDSSEMIRALAKQVVAFCLRNMETFSEIPELKEGAESVPKEVEYPNVLRHLVIDGVEDAESDPPPADEDYIVGGTGVVKALSYCLLQKASDRRRRSSAPGSGTVTPRSVYEQGTEVEEAGKAKEMSKDLLEGARTIRSRLQPALVREARAGNDMGYRRLLYLDQTLQGMIERFEAEYPETRLSAPDAGSTHSSVPSSSPVTSHMQSSVTTAIDDAGQDTDEDEPKVIRSRHNSDVSLASRALSLEEGRLHRLGHRVRTEIINASRPSSSQSNSPNTPGPNLDELDLPEHLAALREKYFTYSGEDIRHMSESLGWEKAFDQLVENAAELKAMSQENPEEFKRFRDTQLAALKNRNPDHYEHHEHHDHGDGDGDGDGLEMKRTRSAHHAEADEFAVGD